MKNNLRNELDRTYRYIYDPVTGTDRVDWMGYLIDEDENDVVLFDDEEICPTAVLTEQGYRNLKALKRNDQDAYEDAIATLDAIDRMLIGNEPDDFVWELVEQLHSQTDGLDNSNKKSRR